ncbi:type IV pilin N-terminal domain-containing protein [Methanoregula sp.]|uniref:type IV pilin N-terminal domain-containing protein n=1 Tax=Methanoregula sp. TaxID=2052170 RepID=UPI00261CA49C|nr:type IV pilin N-terminal domain-containing protein [Methanoregula sp.]MDD5142786.1 type IV pilin N-terminal domain-containing protein [Methanoregula sp.]
MIKKRISYKDDAVSPVVGVMLMLVVTIIIAAVVSAFAGGMADSQKATPSMVLEATYSQADGMTISHSGGDPVALSDVEFRTIPSSLFGPDAEKFAYAFPKTILNATGSKPVINATSGYYYKSSFTAGDVLSIIPKDAKDYITDAEIAANCPQKSGKAACQALQGQINLNAQIWWGTVKTDDPNDKSVYFRSYQFANPANIGKYFYLEMVDPTGNIITRTKVPITA